MHELHIKPNCQIVVTKTIGLSGTYDLMEHFYDKLHTRYASDFLEPVNQYSLMYSCEKEYDVLRNLEWDAVVEASYGGVFNALFQLGYHSDLGFFVDQTALAITQQVIEISEFFQLNPYMLHSQGALVIACENGVRVADALKSAGVQATVAGYMCEEKARIVKLEGEERYLTPVSRDELLQCFEEREIRKKYHKQLVMYNKDDRL